MRTAKQMLAAAVFSGSIVFALSQDDPPLYRTGKEFSTAIERNENTIRILSNKVKSLQTRVSALESDRDSHNRAIQRIISQQSREIEWVPVTQRVGNIEVKILDAVIDLPVVRTTPGDQVKGQSLSLILKLEILNLSETQKTTYATWRPSTRMTAAAVDDLGNKYAQLRFGDSTATQSIYPKSSVKDTVFFEPPVDAATVVRVVLLGTNVGEEENFQFDIRTASIRR